MHQMSIKKKSLYFTAISLCVVLSWVILKKYRDVLNFSEIDYSMTRQIRYGFILQNTTNRLLKHAEFWTYAPVKQTSTQRCIHLEASHPYQLILDDWGNQILHFTFNNLPPYATRILTIKAGLKLSDKPNPISIENRQCFLQAEKYLEIDSPQLAEFAKKFKDRKPIEIAKNIFRWVSGNIQYAGYVRNDRGALYALRNKQGDCTEYMYLFTALCRANHIPARGIGGYVYSKNTVLKPSDYHNWGEFYEDGAWRIADPQKRVFMKKSSHYIAMRVIGVSPKNPMGDFHRFRYAGNGLKVKMN